MSIKKQTKAYFVGSFVEAIQDVVTLILCLNYFGNKRRIQDENIVHRKRNTVFVHHLFNGQHASLRQLFFVSNYISVNIHAAIQKDKTQATIIISGDI